MKLPGLILYFSHRLLQHLCGNAARVFMAFGFATITVGCAGPKMEMGAPPPVDRLAELRVGVSTKDEVRRVLGQPNGEGASRSPDFPGFRKLWSYQVFATDGVAADYTILLIFFDGEFYDGYIWFDNAHDFEVTS